MTTSDTFSNVDIKLYKRGGVSILSNCIYTAFIFLLLGSTPAFADSCKEIADNPEWYENFNALSKNFNDKNYQEALKNAETLKAICDRSPVLNYTIARVYRALGDDTNGLYYIQRATQYSTEFSVNEKLLQQMWAERYEIEHPETRPEIIENLKTEIKDLNNEIKNLNHEIKDLNTKKSQTDEIIKLAEEQRHDDSISDNYRMRKTYGTGLWTGVAIGSIGLVAGAVGTAMLFVNKDEVTITPDKITKENLTENVEVKVNTKERLYTAMAAAGAAMAVSGAIIAGIMGYQYAKLKKDDTTISLQVAPTNIGLTLQF